MKMFFFILFIGSLQAQDWPKVCQQALGWGERRSISKEAPSKSPPQGCPVYESCHGDILYKGDIASQKSHEMAEVTSHEVPSHEVPSHEVPNHEVVVFVSFSMPVASLKALSDEASKHKAVLVMRGLYEDSFVKTSAKLHQMGVTIDINPPLFEEHYIERVPVFIKIKQGKEVARLSGNVSLAFAVSKLDEAA